jgi:hypothetical protein
VLLASVLCLAPLPLAAQPASSGGAGDDLSVTLLSERNHLLLTAVYRLPSVRDILDPIENGLKSRVVFTLRLVEPRAGLFAFLGDATILEKTVAAVGYKDFFENVYVLEDEAGRKKTFAREDDFVAAFVSLSRFPLDEFLAARPGARSFLRLQAKVYPVRLIAPLTLIYLLSESGVLESGWVAVSLP